MLHGEKKFNQTKVFASKHNAKGINLVDFYYMVKASNMSADSLADTSIISYDIGFYDGYKKALSEIRGGQKQWKEEKEKPQAVI